MKVRTNMAGACLALGLALAPSMAHADTTSAPPALSTIEPVTRFDEGWSRALHAVMHDMRVSARAERAAALRAIAGLATPESSVTVSVLEPTAPAIPSPRLLPVGPWRDTLDQSPWAFAPVAIEPATEALGDTRGERGLLLGATLALPWLLP